MAKGCAPRKAAICVSAPNVGVAIRSSLPLDFAELHSRLRGCPSWFGFGSI